MKSDLKNEELKKKLIKICDKLLVKTRNDPDYEFTDQDHDMQNQVFEEAPKVIGEWQDFDEDWWLHATEPEIVQYMRTALIARTTPEVTVYVERQRRTNASVWVIKCKDYAKLRARKRDAEELSFPEFHEVFDTVTEAKKFVRDTVKQLNSDKTYPVTHFNTLILE